MAYMNEWVGSGWVGGSGDNTYWLEEATRLWMDCSAS